MSAEVRIEGLDKLLRKLERVGGLGAVKTAIRAASLHVKGKVAIYPPSTAANVPKAYVPGQWNTWYERGRGLWRARARGEPVLLKKSETLGRKWTIASRDGGLTGVVGNNVSYGPYVQGSPDSVPGQARALKRIGWKNIDEVAKEEQGAVMDFIVAEIERALSD